MYWRFIDNEDGDNDFLFSSATDDSDNGEISNVSVVDAPESEDEEEMEEHASYLANLQSMVYCIEVSVIYDDLHILHFGICWETRNTDGPAAKYYLTETDEYTKYLVNEFSAYNSIQGCNIPMDCYFISVSLGAWVLGNKFTIVGTIHHDRKRTPKEVKALNNWEVMSLLHLYHEESDKKNMIILSTMLEMFIQCMITQKGELML